MGNRHYCTWYYGSSHLIAKVFPFVLEGLSENAQFFVMYEPDILGLLKTALKSNGIATRPDSFIPIPLTQLIAMQRSQGVQGLRKGLLGCLEQARSKGFHQIRVSGQVTLELAVTGSSLEQFLQWEQIYHQACVGLPIATLCMYDAKLSVDDHTLSLSHDDDPGFNRTYILPTVK